MKTMSPFARRPLAGFTLVELLVVIAIIGILAAMSLAVVPGVMNKAKKSKAKLEAQDIVTAVQNYDSTYGRFPVSSGTQTAAGTGDFTYGGSLVAASATNMTEIIAILMDLETYNNGVQTANFNHVKNPKKVIFLTAKMSGDNTLPGVDANLIYRDPWGNPYIISLDLNYDENCEDELYKLQAVSQQNNQSGFNGLVNSAVANGNSDQFRHHGKVMVWSAGPDKKFDVGTKANQGVNKDNILSWQ